MRGERRVQLVAEALAAVAAGWQEVYDLDKVGVEVHKLGLHHYVEALNGIAAGKEAVHAALEVAKRLGLKVLSLWVERWFAWAVRRCAAPLR